MDSIIYRWFLEFFFSRKDSPLEREWKKKNSTISEFFTRFSGRGKSSLRDYRIKNILDYERKEKKKEKIVEVKTKGRADERKREREEDFVPWRRLVRESVACEDERQKGAEKAPDERIRPALERKNVTVIRPQGEEKLAVAASHWPEPRRRRSERSPIPVRLDEPLERERPVSFSLSPFSPPLALPLATPHFILYSLRSAAPLPSLRTGPGKLPRTIFRNGNSSLSGWRTHDRLDKTRCHVFKGKKVANASTKQRWSSRSRDAKMILKFERIIIIKGRRREFGFFPFFLRIIEIALNRNNCFAQGWEKFADKFYES